MNDDNSKSNTPKLNDLVDSYQDTKAPLGFSDRVAARIKDDGDESAGRSPIFIYAMSIGIVAIVAVMVTQTIVDEKPGPQIAQQDGVQEGQQALTTQPEKEKPNQAIVVESAEKDKNTNVALSSDLKDKISPAQDVAVTENSIEAIEEFDANDTGFSNVAVLTDISSWLELGSEYDEFEIYELPDFSEIDEFTDLS